MGRQPSEAPSVLTRSVRESGMWVFGAIAIIMLLALFSYSPQDPGFSHTGVGAAKLNNLIGAAGAWFADFAFYLFGAASYLFPAMALTTGWALCRHSDTAEAPPQLELVLRITGFILALFTTCGLATLHFSPGDLRETSGGVLGQLVGYSVESALGLLGASLLLLALWLASVSLFTGLSWLLVMDWIGKQVLDIVERARQQFLVLRASSQSRQIQQKRQDIVREKREIEQKKPPRIKPRIEPAVKTTEPSVRAEKERQVPLFEPMLPGTLPPLSLLDAPPERPPGYSEEALEGMSRLVELKLRDFGVEVEVVAVHPGPVVTRFELNPAAGVKSSQISNLSKDIARSLSVISVRVVEVIPGKSYVGLEIPNETREMVTLGEILSSRAYEELPSPLTLALGKDISGKSVVADLGKMPHLMIAGTTGSGKSVGINAMVLSLLFKATPDEVRMIMIDPKMLELSVYEGIPHLLCPVVTDMKEAANSLRWSVAEMERRYKLMATLKVRNLSGYNRKISVAREQGAPLRDPFYIRDENAEVREDIPELQLLPNIVIVIDELADMMMIVGKKVEELIARLAQKARAAGIHMIVATQRPSVDVITGLIKANIPCRIAFQVSAKVDSRTILDQSGAENLLGHGDMLFLPTGAPAPIRVHGAFVSDPEVLRVVAQLKAGGGPAYIDEVTEGSSVSIPGLSGERPQGDDSGEQDPLFDQAVQIVTESRRASISGVQRRLKIGYNRAARLVETMEACGIVGPLQTNGSREVIAPPPVED
jgi:S-DNA-T family DNA segregation ATPase FtsK/SpoIIIE